MAAVAEQIFDGEGIFDGSCQAWAERDYTVASSALISREISSADV